MLHNRKCLLRDVGACNIMGNVYFVCYVSLLPNKECFFLKKKYEGQEKFQESLEAAG